MNSTGTLTTIGAEIEPIATSWNATGSLAPAKTVMRSYASIGLLALALALQPTGGAVDLTALSGTTGASGSNAYAFVFRAPTRVTGTAGAAAEASTQLQAESQLTTIRRAFSVPISDVAKVFGVTRAMVYRWIAGSAVPRAKHQERLFRLHQIAAMWLGEGNLPLLTQIHVRRFDGHSVLDLLSADPVPSDKIIAALNELAAARAVVARPLGVQEAFARRGLRLAPVDEASERRDNERLVVEFGPDSATDE